MLTECQTGSHPSLWQHLEARCMTAYFSTFNGGLAASAPSQTVDTAEKGYIEGLSILYLLFEYAMTCVFPQLTIQNGWIGCICYESAHFNVPYTMIDRDQGLLAVQTHDTCNRCNGSGCLKAPWCNTINCQVLYLPCSAT